MDDKTSNDETTTATPRLTTEQLDAVANAAESGAIAANQLQYALTEMRGSTTADAEKLAVTMLRSAAEVLLAVGVLPS